MTRTICLFLLLLPQLFAQVADITCTQATGLGDLSCAEADVRAWIVKNNHYADSFVWPVSGSGASNLIGPLNPLVPTNPIYLTSDPKAFGWYIWNGVGSYYPTGPGGPNYPFHSGEDLNLLGAANADSHAMVYAPANGVVVRLQNNSTHANGHYIMIASLMKQKINWASYTLPGTDPAGRASLGLSDWVTFNNIHIENTLGTFQPKVVLGQKVTKGQVIGYIKDGLNHLHFEAIAGFQWSTAAPGNNQGYSASQQKLTSFDTMVATAAMSRVVTAPSGLVTGLPIQDFNTVDTNGHQGQWTPSGLWNATTRKFSGLTGYAFRFGLEGQASYDFNSQPNGGILMSPVFIAPANPTVKFKTYYETEPQQVDAQGNITRALGTVDKKQVYAQRVGSDDVLLVGEITANTSGGAWQDTAMAIPAALAGLPIRIWFVFNSVDGSNNGYEGWYVDDVSVVTDATANSQTAVVTPTITGMDYAIVGTDSSGKAVINGKFYGSNLNYAGLSIRFFGPGCEKEGLCSVSADQSKSSSTTVYFSASLAKAVYSVKVKNGSLGLYASGYFEIDGNSPANGTCQVSPSASSPAAQVNKAAWQNPFIDEPESITLDSMDAPTTEEVVESTGSQQGQPDNDPLLQTAESENPFAPASSEDHVSQGLGLRTDSQMLRPLAAVCSSFGLTPVSQSKTVVPGGSGAFSLGLSTSITQQVSFTMVIYASAVPAGITASYPSSQSYTANTSYPLNIQIGTSTATPVGSYLFGLRAWINGIMVQEVQMTLVVAASAPPLQFSPTSQSANVVAGSSSTFSFALKNTTTSSQAVTFAMYTMEATNPAGISASWPAAQTLAAGASVNLTATIFTTTATPQRQINFEVRATASGVTVAEALAVVVTATSTPALTVSLTTSNNSPTVNTAVTLTATPSGGSGSGYSCAWNVSTATACSISFTPTTTGAVPISVTAKDSAGKTATASLSLNVQAAKPATLTGYCTVNGSTAAQTFYTGTQITWNLVLSGGTSPTSVVWNGISAGNTQGVILVPTGAAVYNLSATVSDSGNPKQNLSVTCPQVTVQVLSPLGCSCSLSAGSVTLGNGATLYAMCVGGTTPYQFLLPGSSSYGSLSSTLVMPTSVGTASYSITGKDSGGRTATGSCSITVNAPVPTLSSLMPDRTPTAAQPFNLTVYGSGFVSGAQASVCGSSCYTVATSYLDSGRLLLPNVQWNAKGTVSVKVSNPGTSPSNSLTLTIN